MQELQSIIDYGNNASRINAFECCGYMPHVCITNEPFVLETDIWEEQKTCCKQCCHGDDISSFQPELTTFKDLVMKFNVLHTRKSSRVTCKSSRRGLHVVLTHADGLRTSRNLQILDLEDNNIGLSGIVALAGILKYYDNLKVLDLSSNQIDSDGTEALVTGLKHCMNLSVLNLQRNKIGHNGAMALTYLIRYCTRIQMVNLQYNVIDISGAIALAKASTMCLHLQSLIIYANDIDIDSFKVVAAHNPVVVKIDPRILTRCFGVIR